MGRIVNLEEFKIKKSREDVIDNFRVLPREFQIEPMLVMLQTLADIEYIKEEMLELGKYCQVKYFEVKDLTDNVYDEMDTLCKETIETLKLYGSDIDAKINSMKKYFPNFRDGQDMMAQCQVFAKLRNLNVDAFNDEVDHFLGQVTDSFYNQKYNEDATASLLYETYDEYKENEMKLFEEKLKSSEITGDFSNVKVKFQ